MQTGSQIKGRIVIETETDRLWGQTEKVSILLDGQPLDRIPCGKQGVFFIEIGSHNLQAKFRNQESEIIQFRALENDCLNFRCYVTGLLNANVALRALFRRTLVEQRFNSPAEPRFGRRFTDNMPWYEVLKVREDASFEQITSAYLEMMRDFQAEKIAGMNEVEKQYARSRAQKISAAYAQAKTMKG